MAIEVRCAGCHAKFHARDSDAGKTGKCPKCDTPILVPGLVRAEPDAVAEAAQPPAPIIEDYLERGVDKDFRRPDDPQHVIRINQNAAEGLCRKVAEYVPVAGISQQAYSLAAASFIAGTNRQIELVTDPRNPHDPNAIKVVGKWTDSSGSDLEGQLGWVPADTAKQVARECIEGRFGGTIKTMFRPIEDKSPGIRIDIWGPRRPAKKPTKEETRHREGIAEAQKKKQEKTKQEKGRKPTVKHKKFAKEYGLELGDDVTTNELLLLLDNVIVERNKREKKSKKETKEERERFEGFFKDRCVIMTEELSVEEMVRFINEYMERDMPLDLAGEEEMVVALADQDLKVVLITVPDDDPECCELYRSKGLSLKQAENIILRMARDGDLPEIQGRIGF